MLDNEVCDKTADTAAGWAILPVYYEKELPPRLGDDDGETDIPRPMTYAEHLRSQIRAIKRECKRRDIDYEEVARALLDQTRKRSFT